METARYREENERLKAENKRLRRCLKQALANSEAICSILKEGKAGKTDGNRGRERSSLKRKREFPVFKLWMIAQ